MRLAKVDVEGFECKVLSGARRALGSSKIDRITAEVSLLGSAWIQSRVNCSRERIERELLDNLNYETAFRYTMTEATVVAQLRSGPQVTCSGLWLQQSAKQQVLHPSGDECDEPATKW